MRQITEEFPAIDVSFESPENAKAMQDSIKAVVDLLRQIKADYTEVINYNAVTEVISAIKPIPETGRMIVWRVIGATASQPSHYLVYNFNGTILTFASEELA